jgi:hypothetical protein
MSKIREKLAPIFAIEDGWFDGACFAPDHEALNRFAVGWEEYLPEVTPPNFWLGFENDIGFENLKYRVDIRLNDFSFDYIRFDLDSEDLEGISLTNEEGWVKLRNLIAV